VGVAYPEIYWPEVVAEIVPELAVLPDTARADFMFRQTGLWHTTRLMEGAADVLRHARERGLLLGIASNAQPYTLRELTEALESGGLSIGIFSPDLCFWSFAHGFSKPDPHVFRLLTARLRALSVAPAETLMVGDRLDNDVVPASAQGWRTWQLTTAGAECGGDWAGLREFLVAEQSGGATEWVRARQAGSIQTELSTDSPDQHG
jgi:FMN phosphatase YigB (HAD superfamily)